jgi:N-alpha-acetyl-L-2,4-diaminobutyrate deacetylase
MDPVKTPQRFTMQVCVINGERQGPSITIIAGIHGDEPEGSITVHKLAREITADMIQGRLILLPAVNTTALPQAMRHTLPDCQNLDYAFPGNNAGLMSERLAYEITRRFIDPSELIVDLRSGGRALRFINCAAVRFEDQQDHRQRCEDTMIAYGAANSLRLPASAPNSCLQATVRALGKDYIQSIAGGAVTYSAQTLSQAYTGCLNIMRQRQMLDDEIELAATRLLEVRDSSYYIHAEQSGLFAPLTHPGQPVWEGQAMAELYPHNDTSQAVFSVIANRNATLIATHAGGHVNRGDLLAILGEEVQA